jgi:hypothetical protein
MNPDDFSSQELAEALQRLPSLALHAQAARQLIISHRYWLRRPEFRAVIETEVYCGLAYAHIGWETAASLVDQLEAPISELAVLRFACLLAGHGQPTEGDPWSDWTLHRILAEIDEGETRSLKTTSLVLTAFATAATGRRL